MNTEAASTGYDHVQKGVLQPILLAVAVLCLAGFLLTEGPPPHRVIILALAVACGALSFAFSWLAVRDEGERLSVRFGPLPLFRTSIAYSSIVAVEKTRSHPVSGWGIHYTRKGTLWNIAGRDCVRIETGQKSLLVGTDEPERLAEFLEGKMPRA